MESSVPETSASQLSFGADSNIIHHVDYSQPFAFNLHQSKPNKTVDIGRDGVSLSLDVFGRILQAGTFHPEHGIFVAVPFEQFDGSKFYDPLYVRKYRTRILQHIHDDVPGFGLHFGHSEHVSIHAVKQNVALFNFNPERHLNIVLQVQVLEGGDIVQTATVTNNSTTPAQLPYCLNLGVSLNRASYGQLTEGGPIALPQSHNILQISKDGFNITNPSLGGRLGGKLEVNGNCCDISSLSNQEVRNAPLKASLSDIVEFKPGATATIRARFRLVPSLRNDQILPSFSAEEEDKDMGTLSNWKHEDLLTTYILRRNVDYILGNCVIPVSNSATAVITDHVALPLGWNRDNYWQIQLLLETYKHLEDLVHPHLASEYAKQIKNVAKGHLNWVFKFAQRPHGYWHRSYLVTGKPKDKSIFQLDQQCYPLLELCDYLDYFPEDFDFVKGITESEAVKEIIRLLESKRDSDTGLWPTDETPGDDAVIYPYHFSSHILLWRTMVRLRDLWERIASPAHSEAQRLRALASDLRDKTFHSFTFTCPEIGRPMFAYLTNGKGEHMFYHDANDVPTLFAAEWGFATTQSELATWMNTMEFGSSRSNSKGYCSDGPFAGLGSVHSPGAWVLGYFQELAYAAWMKDKTRLTNVWTKIAAAMQWDGTFSEAVDPKTAFCTSKAWFSWPGAMIGTLLIQLRLNHQEIALLGKTSDKLKL